MNYLVTGATGFIGRFAAKRLLEEGHNVWVIVRKDSQKRWGAIADAFGSTKGKSSVVVGDITKKSVVTPAELKKLPKTIDHILHFAGGYDMDAKPEWLETVNVQGTANVLNLAKKCAPKAVFHHISSIGIAGDFKGFFREDMFEEGQRHYHPYLATKYEAEALVRRQTDLTTRIYRPGIVVGSSETGEMDKIDGPYYIFKLIQQIRGVLPQWFPLAGIEGGKMQFAPVDYVANAIVEISGQKHADGACFHLAQTDAISLGDAINTFCKAAHAPELAMRIDTKMMKIIPSGVRSMVGALPMVTQARKQLLGSVGIPDSTLGYINQRAEFDTRNAVAALKKKQIVCPDISTYAWKLWDYWERHLDPDLFRDQTLEAKLKGKTVMITGASSGIGKSVAIKLGEAGAKVLLVARSIDKLVETKDLVDAAGGQGFVYSCDISDYESIDDLVRQALADHGNVDILINNAGRSIRRTVEESADRFHDFERTMQLNYFGALRLTVGLLPRMRQVGSGQVINISSMGVQSNAPRFSAYIASKSAMDAFSRCIAAEVVRDGVDITTIYMPLVRTPMIAPTKVYQFVPTLSPEEAADMVIEGIIARPKRVSTRLGTGIEVTYALAPKLLDAVQSIGYKLFAPSKQEGGGTGELSVEGVAFAHLMRGIHW